MDVPHQHKIGESGLVIFDGSCGACTTFVGERRSFFEKYGFTVAPLQEMLQEAWIGEIGLNEAALMQAIHLITPGKKVLRGPDFFAYLSGKVWWLIPLHLLLKVPFLKRIFAYLYDFVAKRRRKISKICGLQSRAKYSR